MARSRVPVVQHTLLILLQPGHGPSPPVLRTVRRFISSYGALAAAARVIATALTQMVAGVAGISPGGSQVPIWALPRPRLLAGEAQAGVALPVMVQMGVTRSSLG